MSRTDLFGWAAQAWTRPGVEAESLALQNENDHSPSYLLWAAWAASEGRRLDADTLEAGADCARAWDAAAVRALRAVRMGLKKPIPDLDDAAREAVRAAVKAAELEAERQLLNQLQALAPEPSGGSRPLAAALVEAARVWARVVPRAQLESLAAKLST